MERRSKEMSTTIVVALTLRVAASGDYELVAPV